MMQFLGTRSGTGACSATTASADARRPNLESDRDECEQPTSNGFLVQLIDLHVGALEAYRPSAAYLC